MQSGEKIYIQPIKIYQTQYDMDNAERVLIHKYKPECNTNIYEPKEHREINLSSCYPLKKVLLSKP